MAAPVPTDADRAAWAARNPALAASLAEASANLAAASAALREALRTVTGRAA